MPLMPYMSPAAIGWMVVRLRGWPESWNRSPMAASTASGQPRPLDELTVTIASLGISATASAAERTRTRVISGFSQNLVESYTATLMRRPLHRQRQGERPNAILARRRWLALTSNCGMKLRERSCIQVLVLERQLLSPTCGAKQDLANGTLGHHVLCD